MRITIPTAGTRGDVQPAIALGLGLLKAGYQVRLIAFEEYRELITGYGLDYFPLQVNIQTLLKKYGKVDLYDSGAIQFFFVPTLIRIFNEMYESMALDILQATQGSSMEERSVAVIGNPATSMLSYAVAEKLGAAYLESSGFPGWPTRSFPTIFWPKASSPGNGCGWRGTFNRLTYEPVSWLATLGLLPVVSRCRTKILGLPPLNFFGSYGKPAALGTPALACFSEQVLPRPPDWGAHVHVTGYWFADTPNFEPSDELARFLEAGPPPVYIGFGSMPSKDPKQLSALMIQALRLANQRGLLFTNSDVLGQGMSHQETAQDILAIGSTPHDWLFPRCAAVVHHGGAGTTASGLRAGIPSILVPIMGDQLLWAQRVEELGVGPKPIPRSRLTAERLAEAIRQAVNDPSVCQRSTALGKKIRAEDGVGEAVKIIDQYLEAQIKLTKPCVPSGE